MNSQPAFQREAHTDNHHGLFDDFGRLVPAATDHVFSKISRRYFGILQPEIDYGRVYSNLNRHFSLGDGISVTDFETRAKGLLDQVRADDKMRGLLQGVHVPFICPQGSSATDLGGEFDEVFLGAVGKSYVECFPKYRFSNYYAGQLTGQVGIAPGTRYEDFLSARNRGPVVGWYFPNCLSEYSVAAQRALISRLSPRYSLSGGFEAAAALVGTPDLLMRNDSTYPNLLCLSAMMPKEAEFFYYFETYGWNLTFNRRSTARPVSEYWAGGLTLISN